MTDDQRCATCRFWEPGDRRTTVYVEVDGAFVATSGTCALITEGRAGMAAIEGGSVVYESPILVTDRAFGCIEWSAKG